jgi:type II secretion system protein H
LKGQKGFTLIEIMVVVAIIALVSSMVIPSITSYFQVSLTSAAREMSGTIKEAYNSTVITGQVHRLVYDFKESQYWVESGPANILLDTKESREREARKRRFGEKDKKPSSPFTMDKTITKKKLPLPAGVSFEDVITQQSPDPITEGVAFTHFFPHGLIEQTIIHLQDKSKHHVSLVIAPMVGKTDMYERYLTEAEAFGNK